MPRYLTQHTLACLTRQGAEALAQRMQAGGTARAERVLVNMLEGKMFCGVSCGIARGPGRMAQNGRHAFRFSGTHRMGNGRR